MTPDLASFIEVADQDNPDKFLLCSQGLANIGRLMNPAVTIPDEDVADLIRLSDAMRRLLLICFIKSAMEVHTQ